MPYGSNRHARDRNVFDDADRPGPYEAVYPVQRGYEGPEPARAAREDEVPTTFFRGLDEREER